MQKTPTISIEQFESIENLKCINDNTVYKSTKKSKIYPDKLSLFLTDYQNQLNNKSEIKHV